MWREVYRHTVALMSISDLFTINQFFFPPVLIILDFSLVKLSVNISGKKSSVKIFFISKRIQVVSRGQQTKASCQFCK